MNTYNVWVHPCKATTHEQMKAESSFMARKHMAREHGVCITDVVAQRVWADGSGTITATDSQL